jgi:hypothetical protein
MRWLVVLIALAACRSQSGSGGASPSPARTATVPPPAPVLAVQPPLVELPDEVPDELPWVDPDEPKIGAIAGVITDSHGEPIEGATLIATAETMPQLQAAISDETGSYILDGLAPDDYLITLYYVDHTEEHHVTVGDDLAELSMSFDPDSHFSLVGCGGGPVETQYFVDGIDTSGLTFGE